MFIELEIVRQCILKLLLLSFFVLARIHSNIIFIISLAI